MIKLTFCLTRLPGFTREAFQDYWINTHAPLVASVKDTLRIRRYVRQRTENGRRNCFNNCYFINFSRFYLFRIIIISNNSF